MRHALLIYFLLLVFSAARAQNTANSWTGYRGPLDNGYSQAQNVPLHWSDSKNVVWKVPIPGRGWSSPVVLNGKVIWQRADIHCDHGVGPGSSPFLYQDLLILTPDCRKAFSTPVVARIDNMDQLISVGPHVMMAYQPLTGEEIWTQRVGLETSASPVYAGGKIYTSDENGLTTIFAPGRKFNKIAENTLPNGFMASPAVLDKTLYLRTKTHLYRIASSQH
ncbi:MAG: PQQ-binding-like beta-propeller repeat protein [Bacteroidales bacterium]